jgi:hypothetical protein
MRSDRQNTLSAVLFCGSLLLAWVESCAAAPQNVRNYQIPTAAQLASGEQLFKRLFAREFTAPARSIANDLGFSWRETEFDIVLVDSARRGWGEYRFSKTASSDIVLQIPHRYSDMHTGKIARLIFAGRGVTSMALNSVSRRTPLDLHPGMTADMAHLPESFHSAYSRAFAERYPDGHLVQLHGFDPKKRRSQQGQQANVIMSTGTPWSNAYLLEIQQCFIDQGWKALRYPQQVRELGGTTNSIGILMRNLGHSGFTHIELDRKTRNQLNRHPEQLAAFATCLQEAAQ